MARKWEQLYEYYTIGEAEERKEYLQTRIDEKQAKPEEIKEFNKIERVQGYLPEVENLKEGIEALENNLDVLKDEWNKRKEIQKNNRKINKEQRKLEEKAAEIEAKLADAIKEAEAANENDSDYYDKVFKRQELESELTDVRGNIQNLEEQKMDNSSLDSQFSGMDRKELKAEIQKTSGLINRCHLAAECFMNGQSKQSISIQLNKSISGQYKTEGIPLSRKEREEQEQVIEENNQEQSEPTTEPEHDSEQTQPVEAQDELQGNTAGATVDMGDAPTYVENILREEEARRQQERTSAEARRQQAVGAAARSQEATVDNDSQEPQVQNDDLEDRALAMIDIETIKREAENDAKRKHMIRNLISKIPFATKSQNLMKFYIDTEVDQRVEEEISKAKEAISEVEGIFGTSRSTETKTQEQAELSSSRQQRNEFIKGLSNFDVMDIAEKGLKGIETERKEAHMDDLRKKREEFKKAAYDREENKFGKSYADQSYKANDDGDER